MTRTNQPSAFRPAGFTFVEVMFATIILGIGLIMVAALLPVGMRQTTDTADAVTGRAIAENGYFTLQAAANEDLFFAEPAPSGSAQNGYYPIGLPVTEPNPGTNYGFIGESVSATTMVVDSDDLDEFFHPLAYRWGSYIPTSTSAQVRNYVSTELDDSLGGSLPGPTNAIARTFGNRVISSDPRYAWLAFYQRGFALGVDETGTPAVVPSKTAKVTVVALRNRVGSTFSAADAWNWRNGPHLVQLQTDRGGVNSSTGVLTPASVRIYGSNIEPANNVAGVDNPNDDSIGGDDWAELKIQAAAPGAYLIIANDLIEDNTAGSPRQFGDMEGVILRLGQQIGSGNDGGDPYVDFEIDPAFEIPAVGVANEVLPVGGDSDRRPLAWLVGRQFNVDEDRFDGQPMPVGFFQARMPLR